MRDPANPVSILRDRRERAPDEAARPCAGREDAWRKGFGRTRGSAIWAKCSEIGSGREGAGKQGPGRTPELLQRGKNNEKDRWSEHGLGHLLNPTDPDAEDRSWIGQAWLNIIRRSLGLSTRPLGFEKRVAVGRVSVE